MDGPDGSGGADADAASGLGFHVSKPPMETVFDRWLRQARNGLFGVLLTMAKEGHSARGWSIFSICFDFLQLLGYALYGGKFFPWCVWAAGRG